MPACVVPAALAAPESLEPRYSAHHLEHKNMKSICIFCGSNAGTNPLYREEAENTGRVLARRGIQLVYGGGNIGLMGAVADACMEAGGTAIGIIPEALMGKEVAGRPVDHKSLTRLEVVDSMHTRKARMAELSDGFIALPGGFGTFEEFCEILTWGQLGFHAKPMGLLNVNGFYDPLLALFDRAVEDGFLRTQNRAMALTETDIERLLDTMTAYRPVAVNKWLKDETALSGSTDPK